MTRAFVAVRLPPVVLDAVAERVSGVKLPTGRVTTRDQWHLTLQFLGNDADVDAVGAALRGLDARGGRCRLGGAGAFPNTRRARVVWLGVAAGSELLADLARAVGERVAPLGYEPEARAFRVHLTLARCQAPSDVRATIAALGPEPVGPAWEVTAVTLYESRLRREGAEYVERATILLR